MSFENSKIIVYFLYVCFVSVDSLMVFVYSYIMCVSISPI